VDLYVFVIEPHDLRRRLICESVTAAPGLRVIDAVASSSEAEVSTLSESDVFLVNTSLLASEGDMLRSIATACPRACFVLCGSQPDLNALLSVAPLPVRGFLSFSHLAREEFRYYLGVIAHGGAVIEPLTARLLLDHLRRLPAASTAIETSPHAAELTLREQEVLALVRRGLSNKEIALQMRISFGTVRAHLRNIFRKLDVTSRAGAAVSSLGPVLTSAVQLPPSEPVAAGIGRRANVPETLRPRIFS
jgi:DNA-binding NarL/FixJ family response regulator